jgi:hypothetical protein
MNIARERLRNLGITSKPWKRPIDVVRALVASQAQDFAGAKWSLGLRSKSALDSDVERAFATGDILRTHVMRPTWHFVAREDLRWLLELTAPRVQAANAPSYRRLGLDGATRSKATRVLTRALEGGRELTRDELRTELGRAKIDAEGQRMAYLLMHAELDAAICSGARRGKQFTYAHFDERASGARTIAREEALSELAGRYFATRGPATAHDFAKWSGSTVAEAREGLEAVSPGLRNSKLEGVDYWDAPSRTRVSSATPSAHLLSIYDEYISSYRDRSAICEPAFAKRLVGMGAALAYVIVVDGWIVGTWQRTFAKANARVQLSPFRKLSGAEELACREAAERFTHFQGGDFALDLEIRKPAR